VRFVKRQTGGLDAERIRTDRGSTLVATPEQTVLDLAHRPDRGDAETDLPPAVSALCGTDSSHLVSGSNRAGVSSSAFTVTLLGEPKDERAG
jgi:hypothetical protein